MDKPEALKSIDEASKTLAAVKEAVEKDNMTEAKLKAEKVWDLLDDIIVLITD